MATTDETAEDVDGNNEVGDAGNDNLDHGASDSNGFVPCESDNSSMNMDRRAKRLERRRKKGKDKSNEEKNAKPTKRPESPAKNFAALLAKNEDVMLNLVAKINKVYQETLRIPPPFITFVFVGMQSSTKSTLMERNLNAPLNIVQEGTGTRCPLDTTIIHDSSLREPVCELRGEELNPSQAGSGLQTDKVFGAVLEHNRKLADEDKFSTKPLILIYRFVDTPGVISNQSTGKDNREEIKTILRDTMKRPNSKLCVLVEPKEFSTNQIIDFLDDTFRGRGKWAKDSIVIMSKFDKQLEDSRSGSKANNFFSEYHRNGLYPYLSITPTLEREDLDAETLFDKKKVLLKQATDYEAEKFTDWKAMHASYREIDPDDPKLDPDVDSRIGFPRAQRKMREIMLADTAARLPEVLSSLRKDRSKYVKELEVLGEKKKFREPAYLKEMIGNLLQDICSRIRDYLDGDLNAATNFPELSMDLDDELDLEENSDWFDQALGSKVSLQDEEKWRDMIQDMFENDRMPKHVYAESKFIGGKQFQRALEMLKAAMSEAFPDINEMKEYVSSATGYLQGGLQRENWERATLSIVKVTSTGSVHPGINFFIKHVGVIFSNLFQIALKDTNQRSVDLERLREVYPSLENILAEKFNDMLWNLMLNAAEKTHLSIEPWYSSLNPTLPNFFPIDDNNEDEEKLKESFMAPMKFFQNVYEWAHSPFKVKEHLRKEGQKRAQEKYGFLPTDRTPMISEDETEKIILSAAHYVFALQDLVRTDLNFQLNHHFYKEFKDKIETFPRIASNSNWADLFPMDNSFDSNIEELEKRINAIGDSLNEVRKFETELA